MQGIDLGKDIAVIGMSGRFPGADNLQTFFQNLRKGVYSVTEVPASRWDIQDFYSADNKDVNKTCSKWGGYLNDIYQFDPLFFRLAPREAQVMDPQQRLFLEVAWEVLEDAGYSDKQLDNTKCGVFVGATSSDFFKKMERYNIPVTEDTFMGNAASILPSRISYLLNLRGSTLTIDTACSSSLVAVHLACQSLQQGENEMIIAGGVCLIHTESLHILLSKTGMLSPTGMCRPFDDRADGMVLAEGVGAVLLKPLAKALQDRDNIYGVIKGSSINQDGATNGIAAPSALSQTALEIEVYTKSGIDPKTIQYVEAHGTGTKLGDPIEIRALTDAFSKYTPHRQSCAIGSVKGNIGHTQTAAGIVSLIKVLLSLKYKEILPAGYLKHENKHIEFAQTPFYVNKQLKAWEENSGLPRRAAVSSFGASGTNCHLIVEEFCETQDLKPVLLPYYLIPVSGKQEKVITEKLTSLLGWLNDKNNADFRIDEISYTLSAGRSHFKYRAVIIAKNIEDLKQKIFLFLNGKLESAYLSGEQKSINAESNDEINFLIELANEATNEPEVYYQLLLRIGDLYIQGGDVSWTDFYKQSKPRRISLPFYPFQRKSCDVFCGETSNNCPELTIDSKLLYYTPHWESSPIPSSEFILPTQAIILVFEQDNRISTKLRGNSSNTIISIQKAEVFSKKSSQEFYINPLEVEHYQKLFAELEISENAQVILIETWNLGRDHEVIEESNKNQLNSLFTVCRFFIKRKLGLVRFLYFYDTKNPYYEALGGLAKTIGLESSKFILQVIQYLQKTQDEISSVILKELNCGKTELKREVLYLNNNRFCKKFIPLLDSEIPAIAKKPTLFKREGSYLITGGLGGISIHLCKYLASTFNANLVLLGRSVLSSEINLKLQEISALGGKVVYYSVDITNLNDMQVLFNQLKETGVTLQGTIHTAGVICDSLLENKTLEDFNTVITPKVDGALVLDQLTSELKLDFFLMFSSSAALLGNPGQTDYSTANSFLDSFAFYREDLVAKGKRFGKTVSIDWSFWQEGGMQFPEGILTLMEKTTGLMPLPTKRGIQAIEMALKQSSPQFIVLYGDRKKVSKFLENEESAEEDKAKLSEEFNNHQDSNLAHLVEEGILQEVSAIQKIEVNDIEPEINISEYGFDSISITKLINNINKRFDLEVTPAQFFEFKTIRGFVTFLLENNHEELERKLENFTVSVKYSAKEEQNNKIEAVENKLQNSVAIIGMYGVFPGASDLDEFWDNLCTKKSSITEIPKERFNWQDYYGNPHDDKLHSKWGGFLNDVDKFDADFFKISPREANLMDPQHRIFLEVVWKTIEDAAISPETLSNTKTGVFVGVTSNDYAEILMKNGLLTDAHTPIGNAPCILPNRISYLFNLTGPSEPVNTACSSSLTAVHNAIRAIIAGDCDMAIAGGVNIILTPTNFITFSKSHNMLAKDGLCKTFDKKADGYVRSEGAGAVLLKPLVKALADGDPIHAVIRGSAVNHGGHAASLMSPDPNAQADLVAKAWEQAGISPKTIGYIEAHGTGTELGDPIEINGLKKAFKRALKEESIDFSNKYCALGTIKTNVGHLEAAAGIAGLIKTVLSIEHQKIPPILHLTELNPQIKLEDSPFYIVKELQRWEPLFEESKQQLPLRAGISSFGFSGSNAHLILEQAPLNNLTIPTLHEERVEELIIFSAKTDEELHSIIKQFNKWLKRDTPRLKDVAYSLQVGRAEMAVRCAIIAVSIDELKTSLQSILEGEIKENIFLSSADKIEIKNFQKPVDLNYLSKLTLEEVASLWVDGTKIPWTEFLASNDKRRIFLPTYPFARKHYWCDMKTEQTTQLTPSSQLKDIMNIFTKQPAELSSTVSRAVENTVVAHGPFKRINKEIIENQRNITLSEQKKNYLLEFTKHFCNKTKFSKQSVAENRKNYADQRAVASFHIVLKELCYPLTLEKAKGAKVWDIDGNEYIDIAMDFGVNIFGHQADFIQKAQIEGINKGLALGLRPKAAAKAAKLLCELTNMERCAFAQSGTEAVMTAVRLARHVTRRKKLVIFSNSYHGHADTLLATSVKKGEEFITAPVLSSMPLGIVEEVRVLPYGEDASLEIIGSLGKELAAVVVEPVQSRRVSLQPREFLHQLREVTAANETALIFDEMITGFRVLPGGAQEWFGVNADLTTYGKILGGGIGIGALAGKARFMDSIDGGDWNYGDESFPGVERTFFAGTHSQNTLNMITTLAVLEHIKSKGSKLQLELNRICADMANELNRFFDQENIAIKVHYFSSLFRFEPQGRLNSIDYGLLPYHLRDRGIYISEIGNCFLSTAHTQQDIRFIIEGVKDSVNEMKKGGYFLGNL